MNDISQKQKQNQEAGKYYVCAQYKYTHSNFTLRQAVIFRETIKKTLVIVRRQLIVIYTLLLTRAGMICVKFLWSLHDNNLTLDTSD